MIGRCVIKLVSPVFFLFAPSASQQQMPKTNVSRQVASVVVVIRNLRWRDRSYYTRLERWAGLSLAARSQQQLQLPLACLLWVGFRCMEFVGWVIQWDSQLWLSLEHWLCSIATCLLVDRMFITAGWSKNRPTVLWLLIPLKHQFAQFLAYFSFRTGVNLNQRK